MRSIKGIIFNSEFSFKTSRSGGPGGQNVNKVATKVELNFDVEKSSILSAEQKEKVLFRLSNRISNDGVLQIVVQSERSQLANKTIAIKRFYELMNKAFVEQKKRKATRPSKAAKERRLKAKKETTWIKKLRKRNWDDES